ncbi:PatB family C-S lyase [Candidatus Methylospira mobilis]|uniref:MalY/PatB family protein n=1 Tax=Candidatus Methylospira mobilis TaxID=1808979 RepID=UPI0028E7AA69|nr:PatB family C-S lyase [Candidatus Methylospira mobilis]WNV03343.1 PatB family C-S lyase [Candidatus Methylospira mobilis]
MIDFDQPISRQGSHSLKYDAVKAVFGTDDILPLWVADMDFATPPAVTDALLKRAAHPLYGYTLAPDSLFDAMQNWIETRYRWKTERDWLMLAPGVVPTLNAAVLALTRPGDGVIVQPPVYPPFFSAVTRSGRTLVENPLRLSNDKYRMDFDHLESCMKRGARLLLLCAPQNPTGRVWTQPELEELLALTQRYRVTLLSDEIHADLTYPGVIHYSPGALTAGNNAIITAIAPSKTFNIPGLGLSALIIPNPEYRKALQNSFEMLHVSTTNPFSLAAFEAAYRKGGPWLMQLREYLAENRDFSREFIEQNLPGIRFIEPEGTYLLWLDCRELGMNDSELKQFFIRKAKVGLNPGMTFGVNGSGFMRMNIGTRKAVVAEALERIADALTSAKQRAG